jgi:hypothetical protein
MSHDHTTGADPEHTQRRRFLKAVGALGVVGLAGCSGDGDGTESPTGTESDTNETEPPTGTESDTNEPGSPTRTETPGGTTETVTETETPGETEPTATTTPTETPNQDFPSDRPTVVSFSGGGAVEPGGTTTLMVVAENPYLFPLQSVRVSLEAPGDDWTVEATGDTNLGTIEPAGSAEASWEVTAPEGADGQFTIQGSVSYESETDQAEANLSTSITVFDPGDIPQDGIEAYYSLNGDTAANLVTGTDAVENGSPSSGAAGVVGDAFSFDHTSTEGLKSGEALALNGQAATVGAWVNFTSKNDFGRIYQIGGDFADIPDDGWQTRFDGSNDNLLIETRDGGSLTELVPTDALDSDTWYFVVTVLDEPGDEARIHAYDQSGELSNSPYTGALGSPAWSQTGSERLVLMAGGNDEGTSGRMDEVRAYSRALSESEVTTLYQGSLSGA